MLLVLEKSKYCNFKKIGRQKLCLRATPPYLDIDISRSIDMCIGKVCPLPSLTANMIKIEIRGS